MRKPSYSPKLPFAGDPPAWLDWARNGFDPAKQNGTIRTTLPSGYHEVADRLLHASFQILVDYVQRELALEELLEHPKDHDSKNATLYWMFFVRNEALGILFLNRIIQRGRQDKLPNAEEEKHVQDEAELAGYLVHLYEWWVYSRNETLQEMNDIEDPATRHEMLMALEAQEQKYLLALMQLRQRPWF